MSSEKDIFQISPFLNHSNPNSHIMLFDTQDLTDLLKGKNVYLATGFHQANHFHIAMIRPDFGQGGTFEIPKERLPSLGVITPVPEESIGTDIDADKDGVLDSEDKCLGSDQGKTVWNKHKFKEGDPRRTTAEKFHGCHAGQTPKSK